MSGTETLNKNRTPYRVLVPAINASGVAELVPETVLVNEDEQLLGKHYDKAIERVEAEGYEMPHVTNIAFDEVEMPADLERLYFEGGATLTKDELQRIAQALHFLQAASRKGLETCPTDLREHYEEEAQELKDLIDERLKSRLHYE